MSKLALTPYVSPQPTTRTNISGRRVEDTISTLFPDIEMCVDRAELAQRLQRMDRNIPLMLNLQSSAFPKGAQPNLHSNNTSLWVEKLSDCQVHLFSLSPVPRLDDIELRDLVSYCIESQIAPDRAAWAVHHFVLKNQVSKEVLTNTLISDPAFLRSPLYLAKFGYELYSLNLVQHIEFVKWMIQNVGAADMCIFNHEIMRTYCLLVCAFSQPVEKAMAFVEQLKRFLQMEKVQLIQFAIMGCLNGQATTQLLENYQTPAIKQRAKVICSLVSNCRNLGVLSVLRNYMFSMYPYFRKDSLSEVISNMTCFCDEAELQGYALEMCRAVLWFDSCAVSVSSIIACLIKQLGVAFPLVRFVDFLLGHSEMIDRFSALFVELQRFGLIDFGAFWHIVQNKGLFYSHPEVAKSLVLALPCTSRTKKDLAIVNSNLRHVCPGNAFNKDVEEYLGDVNQNAGVGKELPFVMRFLTAQYLTCGSADYELAATAIVDLDVPVLLVDLFKKKGLKNVPLRMLRMVLDAIPMFASHDFLKDFVAAVVAAPESTTRLEIASFLYAHYRQVPCVQEHKTQLTDIVKITKTLPIDTKDIALIARKYSCLFSLHTLDAFYAVKTAKDFVNMMQAFFGDWFSFDYLDATAFFDFFVDFSQSQCITSGLPFFLKSLITALLQAPALIQKISVQDFLREFLRLGLTQKLIHTEQLLRMLLLSNTKKSKGKTPEQLEAIGLLLSQFYRILGDYPELFRVNDILTDDIVKGYLSTFGQADQTQLVDLLHLLRQLGPPIITTDMVKVIDGPSGTPYGAALFSLLPSLLHSTNRSDVFRYFAEEVDTTTSTLWTLWLKQKPYYVPGFPVGIVSPEREVINAYRTALIADFSALLLEATPGTEKKRIYQNCWALLCEDNSISKFILDKLMADLKSTSLHLCPMLVDFLHPALMLTQEQIFSGICEGFCKYHCNEAQFDIFTKVAASVFAIFVSRFPNDRVHIPAIAGKLLEWMPRLYSLHSSVLEFVVDVFDFVISRTNKDAITPEEEIFQDTLHDSIKTKFKEIPEDIHDLIILNYPPQMFKPSRPPLFADFTLEPQLPQTFSNPSTFQQDTAEPAFETNIFDYDDMSWLG